MGVNNTKFGALRRRIVAGAVAVATALGLAVAAPQVASAEGCDGADWAGVRLCHVWSPSMARDIKVQVRPRGSAGVYLLDGLRAMDHANAWTFENGAQAQHILGDLNATLVFPVGGRSSFYTDWDAPSNFNGQTYTYKWETFLTRELPGFLQRTFGVNPHNNAIVGLSMGATAAMNLAGKHRGQFRHATSLSGYLNPSAIGMKTMIRLAMLDEGLFNVDSMWGPPWSPRWVENDPFVNAERYRNLPMYISSSSGLPGAHDQPVDLQGYYNTFNGMVLEGLSRASTQVFEARLRSIGINSAVYSYRDMGTHSWKYWGDELANAKGHIRGAIGA